MAFLRYIFAPLLITGLVLGAVLTLLPRYIDVDQHRESVLEQLNRHIPGELRVNRAELQLLPHIGLRLEGVELDLRDPNGVLKDILRSRSVRIWLDWNSLLADERILSARVEDGALSLFKLTDGKQNLQFFSPSPPSHPFRKTDSNDRPSFFETLRFRSITFAALNLKDDEQSLNAHCGTAMGLRPGADSWIGTLERNGALDLHSGSRRISGIIPRLTCKK